jgi:hypothetical protein
MQHSDATKRELLALEERYWNAIKEKDSAAATSLSDDPCVVVGAHGVGEVDKSTLASILAGVQSTSSRRSRLKTYICVR